MAIILLDADVIIRGEKGLFDLRAWLRSRSGDEIEIAAITVAELWHGVERASGGTKEKRMIFLRSIFAEIPVIDYTTEIALEHARIWAQLESAGKMAGYYDIIVAATALSQGGEVATFNRRHFDCVPNLKVIEPK